MPLTFLPLLIFNQGSGDIQVHEGLWDVEARTHSDSGNRGVWKAIKLRASDMFGEEQVLNALPGGSEDKSKKRAVWLLVERFAAPTVLVW